jgi:hypothetical protein
VTTREAEIMANSIVPESVRVVFVRSGDQWLPHSTYWQDAGYSESIPCGLRESGLDVYVGEYQLTDFSRVHAQTFAARPAPAGERGG